MLNRTVSVNGPVPSLPNFKVFLFLRSGLCNETRSPTLLRHVIRFWNRCLLSRTYCCFDISFSFWRIKGNYVKWQPCFSPDHQVMRRESRRHVGETCPVREQYLRERNIPIIVLIVNGLGKHIFQCPIQSLYHPVTLRMVWSRESFLYS